MVGKARERMKMVRNESGKVSAESFRRGKETRTNERSKEDAPIFVGKWTVQMLFELHERPHRHGHLQRRLRGVSQRMLTRTLRGLESTGLIGRNLTGFEQASRRILVDRIGKNFHCTAHQHVPVGETRSQGHQR